MGDAQVAPRAAYTDDQACVTASVDGGPPEHRRTIPAWAAQSPPDAVGQRAIVRREVRAEIGDGPRIVVAVVPGYCPQCRA